MNDLLVPDEMYQWVVDSVFPVNGKPKPMKFTFTRAPQFDNQDNNPADPEQAGWEEMQ